MAELKRNYGIDLLRYLCVLCPKKYLLQIG